MIVASEPHYWTRSPDIPSPGLARLEPRQSWETTVLAEPSQINPAAAYLGLVCAALVVVGSLGPWIQVSAMLVGTVTVNGTHGDGKITIVCGLLGGLFLLLAVTNRTRRLWGVLAMLCLGFAGIAGLIDIGDVSGVVADANVGRYLIAETGWGLYAVVFGGLAGAACALVQTIAAGRR